MLSSVYRLACFSLLLCPGLFLHAQELRFRRDIHPILAEHCFACHGLDEATREADLRLDQRAVAVAKKAIVPSDPAASELLRRIGSRDPDVVMPPPDHGHLNAPQRKLLERWIHAGAPYERHWAFVPPEQSTVPLVGAAGRQWCKSPIDHFIFRRLAAAGLEPAVPASRETLIRRLYLDLLGLPPTGAAVQTFVNDRAPDAYERLVDRVLMKPGFGEHWARMWLDLARYADSKGYEKDNHRDIWRYRDWVIHAYNADLPYSQFTLEQLAGDLLPHPTSDQILATAFHRNTMTNDEGGTDDEEFRTIAVKDRVDTTVQVWMGLTMGCAKCHSHKYDPISQRDYYRFYAFFNQTADADRSDESPKLATPSPQQAAQLVALQQRVAAYMDNGTDGGESDGLSELRASLERTKKAIPQTPVLRELPANERRTTHIHLRGNFLVPGEVVTPALPAALGSVPQATSLDRRMVAAWLLQPDNPLTARVAVNRVWARIFGRGLVETEEDFGTQGAAPSHPALLDWLATEYQNAMGWSHKRLCRQIVLSAAYRQAATVSKFAREADPQNHLFSRAPRYRLTAETVRDQALAVAGLLTSRVGGPSVMPPQPRGIWQTTYSKLKWNTATDSDRFRRGLYTYWRRTSPYPSMTTFDAGSREVCLVRRVRTNIPLQALVTMNDPVFVEAAGGLARIALATPAEDDRARIVQTFARVLVRRPVHAEVTRLERVLMEAQAEFAQQPRAAIELLNSAGVRPQDPAPLRLASWTILANVLLNLDETLMRP